MPDVRSTSSGITASVSYLDVSNALSLNPEKPPMPTWTKSPPADPRGHGLPLLRAPATGCLRAIVTSHELVGTDTHFWGGHTVPCERPDCDACREGMSFVWHGYISAYNPLTQLHFIFEMTCQAAHVFNEFYKKNGTLRTAQFEAYRWHRRKNGRVIVKIDHSATPASALPKAPDIEKVMAIIWRLPEPNVFIAGLERGLRKINATSDGDGQSDDPRLYETTTPDPRPAA